MEHSKEVRANIQSYMMMDWLTAYKLVVYEYTFDTGTVSIGGVI